MKKILVCLPSLTNGDGIAKFYMNYYKNIKENGYIVDFLCVSHDEYSSEILKKIENSKIFIVPNNNFFTKWVILNHFLKKEFSNNSYDIIHDNLTDANALIINNFFKKRGSKIILHVHNPINKDKKMINRIFLKVAIRKSDYFCACSESAGKSVFKCKKFKIVKNKVDVVKFKFDKNNREKIRKELNVSENCILIGTVGRMCNQKNPMLVYKIIRELCNEINCKSIWIGNGELENSIKDYVRQSNIEDKCIFIGSTAHIEKYYSAMDVFLLPSIYEGLGIVFIEAQASGLEVFTSNIVPEDICITDIIYKLDLKKDINDWVNEIKKGLKKNHIRENYYSLVYQTDFNIEKDDDMTKIYNKILVGEK